MSTSEAVIPMAGGGGWLKFLAASCERLPAAERRVAEWVLVRPHELLQLSLAQVAQRTAMDKVAVSRAVASLVRAGRVARSVEESDRRRSRLRLTGDGMLVYQQVVPWALAYEDAVLRGIPPRMRAVLHDLLDELSVSAATVAARGAGPDPSGTSPPDPAYTLRRNGE